MLLAKTQEGGIHGLGEEEMTSFCSLSRETLLKLSRELEEEGGIIAKPESLYPLARFGYQPEKGLGGYFIWLHYICIAENLYLIPVMRLENRFQKIGHRVCSEIRGHITNPQSAVFIHSIPIWQNLFRKTFTMQLVPLSGFPVDLFLGYIGKII